MRRQRGERGGRGGLRFLAAKPAAHARALHDDLVGRQLQQVGDDGLHLGGMLRGGRHEHRAVLARLRPRRLRFEIKMLLPAQLETRLSASIGESASAVADLAAPDEIRLVVEAACGERLLAVSELAAAVRIRPRTFSAAARQASCVSPTTSATIWP